MPNIEKDIPDPSMGRKHGKQRSGAFTLLLVVLSLVTVVIILLSVLRIGEPYLYRVYRIESVTDDDVTMQTLRFTDSSHPFKEHRKTFKVSYFNSNNRLKLQIGSFAYFYRTRSGSLTGEITPSRKKAEALARGLPGPSRKWDTQTFTAWLDDPIKYNAEHYSEPEPAR